MSKIILAIESSCDETAAAIIKDEELLANIVSTQIEVHTKYGGVMPEIASRLHCENIAIVLKEALDKAQIKLEDISAVAVTRGPGLIGALHVGIQAAKTIALLYNKVLLFSDTIYLLFFFNKLFLKFLSSTISLIEFTYSSSTLLAFTSKLYPSYKHIVE